MRNRYFIIPMLALPVIIVGCFETLGFPVSGVEFSPDTFAQRNFSYRRSPFTGTVRSKRVLTPVVSDCDSLITLNLIPAVGTASPRWDLVSESLQSSTILSDDFDARFLVEYLDETTDQWNRENIQLAEILWPEIAKLVREQLYLQLPALLTFAVNTSDDLSVEDFQEQLNQKLAEAWFQAAVITAARARSDEQLKSSAEATDPPDNTKVVENLRPATQPATSAAAKRFLKIAIEYDPSFKHKNIPSLEKIIAPDSEKL